jgi:purine nucleosidase
MRSIALLLSILSFFALSAASPVVIDTDAGIDDAAAILLLAHHDDWDVVGVCSVFGNVPLEQALRNCAGLMDLCDMDEAVPLYRGAAGPFIGQRPMGWPGHGLTGLGNATLPSSQREVGKQHSALGLIDLSHQHSGLHLLALGPLSNIALAVTLDPTLPQRIDRIVVMGGTLAGKGNHSRAAEFNFFCDPEAAQIVLHAFHDKLELVTWELTAQPHLDWRWLDQLHESANSDVSHFLIDCCDCSRQLYPDQELVMCDLLAAAVLVAPEIVSKQSLLYGSVETGLHSSRGAITYDWYGCFSDLPNLTLIEEVDSNACRQTLWAGLHPKHERLIKAI